MINLPFRIKFDLDFSKGLPKNELINKIKNLFSSINPAPYINLKTVDINQDLYDFITYLYNEFEFNLTLINPKIDKYIILLLNKSLVDIEITDYNYNLLELQNYQYNLSIDMFDKIYDFLNKNNKNNIKKILLHHNNTIDYTTFKNQLGRIKSDFNISNKTCLIPYLEEYELEKFYNNTGEIRKFLTCSSLWFNPTINEEGRILFPCFKSNKTILDIDFFDLWNETDINILREKLINDKQLSPCKYCKKFYEDTFLIVEENKLEYKNKIYNFDNTLNPVKSAPNIGIVKDGNTCDVVPLYSNKQIVELFRNKNLIMILK